MYVDWKRPYFLQLLHVDHDDRPVEELVEGQGGEEDQPEPEQQEDLPSGCSLTPPSYQYLIGLALDKSWFLRSCTKSFTATNM